MTYWAVAAAELRAEMARKRVTGTELASVLGISQAAVSRRTVGDLPMDMNELQKITARLGLTVGAFVQRVDEAFEAASRRPGSSSEFSHSGLTVSAAA